MCSSIFHKYIFTLKVCLGKMDYKKAFIREAPQKMLARHRLEIASHITSIKQPLCIYDVIKQANSYKISRYVVFKKDQVVNSVYSSSGCHEKLLPFPPRFKSHFVTCFLLMS
jgi:hypothetical protein